ncbi:MAG: hypothetical protein WCI00_08505 [bacterium]
MIKFRIVSIALLQLSMIIVQLPVLEIIVFHEYINQLFIAHPLFKKFIRASSPLRFPPTNHIPPLLS